MTQEIYFVRTQDIKGRRFFLNGQEAKHCFKVMRNRIGDCILLTDGKGKEYSAKITKINQRSSSLEGEILEIREGGRELKTEIYLAFAPIKSRDLTFLIEKATELGVRGFIPVKTERTVANFRKERLERVAIEGLKRGIGTILPQFSPITPFASLLSSVKDYSLSLLGYENEEDVFLKDLLGNIPVVRKVLVIIGPEGGFTPYEVEQAKERGVLTFSLGKRRLSAGTAALAALAIIIEETRKSGVNLPMA